MKNTCAALLAGSVFLAAAGGSAAQDMVYTPINPSFGGSPLNSSHLLGLANAQRTATARKPPSGTDPTDPGSGSTDADLFVRQLQSRLLSALASQVTEAIFGENPQESGTVRFGDTTVTYERTIDSIRLVITDPTGVTEIVVPLLVASNNATNSLMQNTGGLGSSNGLSGGLNTGDLTSSTALSPGLN